MGDTIFTSEVNGTGGSINLGSNYPAGTYYIWSKTSDDCSLLQDSVIFENNNLSVNDFIEDKKINIFPNPANQTVNISFDTNDKDLSLEIINNIRQIIEQKN